MITLLVTFTAIVLGLLTTSVKAGFDTAYSARGDDAAQLAQLDRCLRDYGPETAPIREHLRGYVGAVIASTWPDEPRPEGVAFPDPAKMPRIGESPNFVRCLERGGTRRPRASANGRVPQQAAGRMRWTIQRLAAGQMEGDRGRAPLFLASILLGVGDLAFNPVRIVRPDGASQRDGGDGDGSCARCRSPSRSLSSSIWTSPMADCSGCPAPRCAMRSPT